MESDRWDVHRFWLDEELVEIGEREEAVDRASFLDEIEQEITEIAQELVEIRSDLTRLTSSESMYISMGINAFFRVRKGTRITRKMARDNPGELPVYSGRKDPNDPLGLVSESWARSNGIRIEEKPLITVNANGYVGATFVRREKCIVHDDVMAINVLNADFDLDYIGLELQAAINEGNFEYEAKLYSRVKELGVKVPIEHQRVYSLPDGSKWTITSFDIEKQRQIATTIKKFNTLKARLAELGQRADRARTK